MYKLKTDNYWANTIKTIVYDIFQENAATYRVKWLSNINIR
jgi:hypothetical protein